MSEYIPGQYPLQWPVGWPRTPHEDQVEGRFHDLPFGRIRHDLAKALRQLGASNPVLSANIPLKRDGEPRANFKVPEDPGVAVYFTLNGEQMCMASDRYWTVESNVRAIFRTIEGMRSIQRYGCSDLLNRAMAGFKALGDGTTWWQVLELERPPTSFEAVHKHYRTLVTKYHSDLDPSNGDKMRQLNIAREEAREHFGRC